MQEAESGRFVCGVTHRLQRRLSDKPGAKSCGRWVGRGQRFLHILSHWTPPGPHLRPPQPRPLLAESVKIQTPITAPTPPPLQGAGGVRLHSALTEHQVRVCVCVCARKAYSKTFYPPPAERRRKTPPQCLRSRKLLCFY